MPGTPDQTLFLCATDPGVPAHGNLRLLGPLTAQAKRTPRRAQRAARSPRHSHRPRTSPTGTAAMAGASQAERPTHGLPRGSPA